MRIGVRACLCGMVVGCVLVSAGTAHFAWQSVAGANSRALAGMLGTQVARTVQGELDARLSEAEASFAALRTLFTETVIDSREADRREFVFLSQIEAQPALSWVAFGWADGSFFGSHRLGDDNLEMVEITPADDGGRRRTDSYRLYPETIEFRARTFSGTDYDVTAQPWYRDSAGAAAPAWFFVNTHPDLKRGAIAFAGPIDVYGQRQGVLAVIIELSRLSHFLSHLDVGGSGAAFILSGDGSIVAGPDPQADERTPADFSRNPFLPLVRQVGERMARGLPAGTDMLGPGDLAMPYAVFLAPLGFKDWRVAVAIPEAAFLGRVDAATMRLGASLAGFTMAAAVLSAAFASRVLARPLRAIAGDLGRVEAFELAGVPYRQSRLKELDALSASLVRTTNGLAAFGKYLPRDLVRTLVAEGIPPTAGGESRALTVLFADVAGFTGLSERLGPAVVPLIGRFLELVSEAVEAHGGTVDKFIGDAVMAFWGAPRGDPDQAHHACLAALAALGAIRSAGLTDDLGMPLRIRFGVHSGIAVVGNVGSDLRLNYTALGDTVNLASRLEGANKSFGTAIIISEDTRRGAGDRIVARELDRVAVYGRAGGTTLYELLDRSGSLPDWAAAYEAGLQLYRSRDWQAAGEAFARASALRPGGDPAAQRMHARCRERAANPPAPDWTGIQALESK